MICYHKLYRKSYEGLDEGDGRMYGLSDTLILQIVDVAEKFGM